MFHYYEVFVFGDRKLVIKRYLDLILAVKNGRLLRKFKLNVPELFIDETLYPNIYNSKATARQSKNLLFLLPRQKRLVRAFSVAAPMLWN